MVFDTLEAEKLIHLNTLRNDLKKVPQALKKAIDSLLTVTNKQ